MLLNVAVDTMLNELIAKSPKLGYWQTNQAPTRHESEPGPDQQANFENLHVIVLLNSQTR